MVATLVFSPRLLTAKEFTLLGVSKQCIGLVNAFIAATCTFKTKGEAGGVRMKQKLTSS